MARDTKLFDGFLIHSRDGGAALFDGSHANANLEGSVHIRSDLGIPVLVLTTESDLLQLSYVHARQPDSKYFRDWEIAGTSHYDTYSLSVGPKDDGTIDADAAFFRHDDHHRELAVSGDRRLHQADQCRRSDVRRCAPRWRR